MQDVEEAGGSSVVDALPPLSLHEKQRSCSLDVAMLYANSAFDGNMRCAKGGSSKSFYVCFCAVISLILILMVGPHVL